MWKTTLRNIVGHKFRLFLTSLAITIGVGFVAGTFILTDTLNKSFDTLFNEVTAGLDAQVQSTAQVGADPGDREPIPESLLGIVRNVDGVKHAEGGVFEYAQVIDKKGKPIANGGAPTFGASWLESEKLSALKISSGRPPRADGEVVLDSGTAKKAGFKPGDKVRIVFAGPTEEFTVVGISKFGEADNLLGATLSAFELRTAQRVLDRENQFTNISAVAEDGVSASELVKRIRVALPNSGTGTNPTYEAITGTQAADDQTEAIEGFLGFFETALLVFAGISVFVGSFIIANIFSIIVAQRTRELALLRALGASRRQVTRSVLVEALVVGTLASILGIALGFGLALGLRSLFSAFGLSLPSGAMEFRLRTPVVSFLVGVVVTAIAAFIPARRAAKVAPVEAMREGQVESKAGFTWKRTLVGIVMTGGGGSLILAGLFAETGNRPQLVGAGAALSFLGVTLLSPLAVWPLAQLLGVPLARFSRVAGRLSKANAVRNPRRTASTAAALMIGLGLISTLTIMASSVKESSSKILDEQLAGDYYLHTEQFYPFSADVAERLSRSPGIEQVAPFKSGMWKYKGKRYELSGIDPASVGTVLKFEFISGSGANLAKGQLLVDEDTAKDREWKVGDVVPMEFSRTGIRQVVVGGIFKSALFGGSHLISTAMYEANYTDSLDQIVLATRLPGVANEKAADRAIAQIKKDFPNVKVEDQAGFKKMQGQQIDQALGLLSVLLMLSVIVAFIGIVATLGLSIFERTREIGLLRAVGMSRRQVRRMIRGESVIMAVLGALLGVTIGVLFGIALVKALSDQGITELVVPAPSLAVYVVIAALLGMIAALWPARRASRLNILQAIASD